MFDIRSYARKTAICVDHHLPGPEPVSQEQVFPAAFSSGSDQGAPLVLPVGIVAEVGGEGRYVRLSVLAELLSRDPDGLRKGYLDALVKQGLKKHEA